MNLRHFYFDAGPLHIREEVIRLYLSLAVTPDNEVGADTPMVPAVELDAHEESLKRDIVKGLEDKPLLGLKFFRRNGDYTVYVPIGAKFLVDRALEKQHVVCCDTVVNEVNESGEPNEYYNIERLQKVVDRACQEAGIALLTGVSRKIHVEKGIRMFTFEVQY